MAYLYENLDAERFQHFCQALLVRDYPDLQCFPVGQPDGGRDALSRGVADHATVVVGQVKFKRVDEEENAAWMIETLEKELPKIIRLVARGATRYLMMTNARGTAHQDVGRIDLVQAWLDENVTVPASVIWRDDLDRRLDGADAALKLTYPSLLTGADALTLIVAAQMGPHKERIGRTLRAFVAEQYRKDEEVKFRQVELANSLLALFVDVPANITKVIWPSSATRVHDSARNAAMRLGTPPSRTSGVFEYGDDTPSFTAGTADLLLDSDFQAGMPWIVLQGAPGQGKSTLAQYVCQVHRARYLNKVAFLAELPDSHLTASFRLPIKVDLRDFAGYLDGQPYLGTEGAPATGVRTVEKFLASLISIQSGGLDYSPDDFSETVAGVPTLLFLDGLDEVADLGLRKTVIERVVEGLNRIKENHADIQVVVTSRPSLFGRAPSFSKSFERLDLAPIDSRTVRLYADKWVTARRLDTERGAEVLKILSEKLELPHIRELTKNPMQLTILLSLILSIGHSLPDVRTDLYREYMNLFMTREAEKSPVVREHRALLLEIVEFLAWTLQSGAETDRKSGSISGTDIRTIISGFLERGDFGTEILDDLFTGGLERVYVLVQRVEGLYEFEVQPLREYFAAKHLYSSAPVGTFRHKEVNGDRAQRFEAIAANPYWANVTRFYAGFYEGGEIGALGSSLRELASSRDLAVSVNARSVGAALLTDWIFKSKKFVQNEVIGLVFDPLGVYLASISRLSGFENGALDKQCGREVLSRLLFENHVAPEANASARRASVLLRRNGGEALGNDFEEWIADSSDAERTRRLTLAITSGAMSRLPTTSVELLVMHDEPSERELYRRLRPFSSSGLAVLRRSEVLTEAALESVLSWGGYTLGTSDHNVPRLATLLSGSAYQRSYHDWVPTETESPSERLRQLETLLRSVQSKGLMVEHAWDDADLWNGRIEAVRDEFGDTWSTFRLAALTVGLVRAGSTLPVETIDLNNPSVPLFLRAAAGRTWKGRASWWESRLKESEGHTRLMWLAVLLLWAPSKHVIANLKSVAHIVGELTQMDLERLDEVLTAGAINRGIRGGRARNGIPLLDPSDTKTAYFLFAAFGEAQLPFLPKSLPEGTRISQAIAARDIEAKVSRFPGWGSLSRKQTTTYLSLFAELQATGFDLRAELDRPVSDATGLSVSNAEKILRDPYIYPVDVAIAAHSAIQMQYKPKPVLTIAVEQSWSFE